MDKLLDQIEPLTKQLEDIFERLTPMDARARVLFEATKPEHRRYEMWQSNISGYRRYLPSLNRTDRGTHVTSSR